MPIFREAILNGAPEVKEQAAQGLGEVIRLTSAEALQPSVVHITGPLIRILGDRFNWSVKAAVLETLAILLAKVCVIKLLIFLELMNCNCEYFVFIIYFRDWRLGNLYRDLLWIVVENVAVSKYILCVFVKEYTLFKNWKVLLGFQFSCIKDSNDMMCTGKKCGYSNRI